jgi:hypothetical protein
MSKKSSEMEKKRELKLAELTEEKFERFQKVWRTGS